MARFQFHKQGRDVSGSTSIGEVLERGGLAYPVSKVPAAAVLPDGSYRTIADKWATVRTDSGAPLGVVGSRYRVVQNDDAFGFQDAAIRSGELKPERAGTFDGGGRAWILSRFNGEAYPAPGDKLESHLLTLTGHDGSCAVSIMPMTIRLVCTNGLTVCEGNKALEVTIRHGHSAQQRIDRFGSLLAKLAAKTGHFYRTLEGLARKQIGEQAAKDYFARLYPVKPATVVEDASLLDTILAGGGHDASELVKADSDYNARILAQILDNYRAEGIPTAWGALNAVTEFTTPQMRTKGGEEGRLQSVLLGGGAENARQAYAAAMTL